MKSKIFLIFMFFVFPAYLFSQDLPFAKQYIFDQTLLNPALGAKYDFISLKLSASDQWQKLPKNPQTQAFSFNMKFKNTMGFNAALLNEQYGVIRNSGLKFSYFYYTKLNVKGDYLSYGVSAGLMQYNFEFPQNEIYSNDPSLNTGSLSYIYPNAGLGIYYHHNDLALGFSAGNLIPYKPKALSDTSAQTRTRTYFFYADTKFANEINTIALIPSVLLSVDEKFKRQININSKLVFYNKFWLGLSYRDALSNDAYAIHNLLTMVGFKVFKRLNIAYGYDFGILSVRSVMGGTHFFMIGFDFIDTRKQVPMYF